MTFVCGPASWRISALEPTARMRSCQTARAVASGCFGFTVQSLALRRRVSGEGGSARPVEFATMTTVKVSVDNKDRMSFLERSVEGLRVALGFIAHTACSQLSQ